MVIYIFKICRSYIIKIKLLFSIKQILIINFIDLDLKDYL